MKDNKIDELFRQKLSHQKLTPPPSTWAAVEQNLPGEKKRGVYFWISIAASLLLICTLGWLVLSNDTATDTPDQLQASAEKPAEQIKNPESDNQTLVAAKEAAPEKEEIVNDHITEPSAAQVLADNRKKKSRSFTVKKVVDDNNSQAALVATANKRELLIISPIKLEDNLSINSMAGELDFDMIMPVVLTDYHIPYSEDMRPIRKKKKFRVLNGIISIAKEVNSGKLSLSELRNAKNNFVTDDLKYGTKTDEGVDDDSEDEPFKD